MPFVFDTSSWRVLGNYYPERFPSFWDKFEEILEAGEVISVREVHRELENQVTQGWFQGWIKKNNSIFHVPGQGETAFVAQIFSVPHFRNLVGQEQQLKGNPVADPFVVASAGVRGFAVVTEEANRPNAAKIPNVCERFNIECVNLETFLARQGWSF